MVGRALVVRKLFVREVKHCYLRAKQTNCGRLLTAAPAEN